MILMDTASILKARPMCRRKLLIPNGSNDACNKRQGCDDLLYVCGGFIAVEEMKKLAYV